MTSTVLTEPQVPRLTRTERDALRPLCDADPWVFAFSVAATLRGGVERFHRPLLYLLCGPACTDLLAVTLDDPEYDSELTRQIRAELSRRRINWHTAAGRKRLALLARRLNIRIARSFGKSIYADLADLWLATKDPNISIGIASKSDASSYKHLAVIANIIRSDEYQFFYPERIRPKNPEAWINQDWIQLYGRTNPDETTFFARGISSGWTTHHFTRIRTDDIIGSESGDADETDALRFLANITSIARREGLGGYDHLGLGTVYGQNDDYSALARIEQYLTVRVPIWLKRAESTVANVKVDGDPVLPEWANLEQIRNERAIVIADPRQGPIAWIQNAELTAHREGVIMFTREGLERQTFEWTPNPKFPDNHLMRLIRRPVRRQDAEGLWHPVLETDPRTGRDREKMLTLDPFSLPRMLGIDPSYSTASWANHWAITCTAIDQHGHKIQLQTMKGKGKGALVAAIPIMWHRWTLGGQYPIRKIGIDSSAMQAWAADFLQREDAYRAFARRFEKIPSGESKKRERIYLALGAGVEMGEVWLAPEPDNPLVLEALAYNPNDDDADDDALDSGAISISLHSAPASVTEEDLSALAATIERDWKQSHHTQTWIETESYLDGGLPW